MKHAQEQVPLPSPDEVKEPVMRAVLKALAKKPEDRWATALAFAEGLEAALQEAPTAQVLPTLELTEQMPASDARTATAVARPTAPAATAPTRPPQGRSIGVSAPPARTSPASAPAAPDRVGAPSPSTGLAVAIGFGGVAALVLAGVVAVWVMRRPTADETASPSPLPEKVTVAANPPRTAPAPLTANPAPRSRPRRRQRFKAAQRLRPRRRNRHRQERPRGPRNHPVSRAGPVNAAPTVAPTPAP